MVMGDFASVSVRETGKIKYIALWLVVTADSTWQAFAPLRGGGVRDGEKGDKEGERELADRHVNRRQD